MSAQPASLLRPTPSVPHPRPRDISVHDLAVREIPSGRLPAGARADRPIALPADPDIIREDYFGNARLLGRVALITGGGDGLGRAVALHYAREGARVVIAYDDHDPDAEQAARECQRLVRLEGSDCLLFRGDLRRAEGCREAVARAIEHFGHLDVLVNNGACSPSADLPGLRNSEQFDRAFRNRMLAYLLTSVEALPRLRAGGSIINTVPAPHAHAAQVGEAGGTRRRTDGGDDAIHAFTVSLAEAAAERGIRVNAVAPGPVGTAPAGPAGGTEAGHPGPGRLEAVAMQGPVGFGTPTLLGRAGLPAEVAPAYVFLASDDATFITGQTLHVNGGGPIHA